VREARPRLSAAAINYRPRIIGFLLFPVMLMSIPGEENFAARSIISAFCLLWPHAAYWIARRRGGDSEAERMNILLESFLGGVLAVAFSLRLWPTSAAYVIGMINPLLFGGPRFLVLCVAMSAAGFVATWLAIGLQVHVDTEPLATALSAAAVFAYIIYIGNTAYRLRQRQRETRLALEREERKSHELLINVFPEAIVPRLRSGEAPIADQFADVSVVFADIVEFTPLAERLGPKRTVLLLNDLFRRFDQAAAALRVEKIETTGDGYLAVAGAPQPHDSHPVAAADFAIAAIAAAKAAQVAIRVGIHTGPIFGGVIGESRFHYKIFGDTVNTASRVQGQAHPGCILVSDATRRRIEATHALEERGTIDLKGHGPMRTWWLLSKKT
jgi:class 3 adenylate cyclase